MGPLAVSCNLSLCHGAPSRTSPWTSPPSSGNTVILTVVDRFSKMARFINLPKLPSAKETAEVMLTNVFRVYGFPRGLQFVVHFWKSFCLLFRATANLTSGFHPQSNGQTGRG